MKKLTQVNLVFELVAQFPEFRNFKDYSLWDINDPEARGSLVWVFGDFVADYVKNADENSALTQRIFKFLNEKYDSAVSDEYVMDYFYSEVYESIATSRKAINIAKKYLAGQALDRLNETLKWYQPVNENT